MSEHRLAQYDLRRFDLREQHTLLPSLIQCYQRVFAGEPWNEWLECRTCGATYGVEKPEILLPRNFECCGKPLTERWSAWQVVSDLNHELITNSSCWIALNRETVIGFCWGYPITPEKLELKLKLPGVAETIKTQFETAKIAYQDELGVLPEYRGLGLAKALFLKRHQDFRQQGLEVGVVRTKRKPPSVTYEWFTTKLSYATIASYEPVDGRVVLARNISTLFQEGA